LANDDSVDLDIRAQDPLQHGSHAT
jgi:hypothetical protein